MRLRLPLGRRLFVLCATLFALVALFPLRLALDGLSLDTRSLSAREAKGSIWFGGLSEAQFGGVELGDVQARLRILPLFVGLARLDLERDTEENAFKGSITVSRNGFGIDDATGTLDVGSTFAPLPIARLELGDVSARFADGQCASAEGLVKTRLAGDLVGLPLSRELTGAVRCDKAALLLPLAGPTGSEALNIRLLADGGREVELVVRPADDQMRNRLIASGFTLTRRGYVLSATL